MRDTDNDRLYSFELTEQLLSGSQVEAWKEIAAKTLAEGGDEAERKPLDPLKGNSSLGWNTEEMKVNFTGEADLAATSPHAAFPLFTVLCSLLFPGYAQNEPMSDL